MLFKIADTVPSLDTKNVFFVPINPETYSDNELFKSFFYQLWFPGYFGFNWNALNDCLRDLSWIDMNHIVIYHQDIPKLCADDLIVYLKILNRSILDWKNSGEREFDVFFPSSAIQFIESAIGDK